MNSNSKMTSERDKRAQRRELILDCAMDLPHDQILLSTREAADVLSISAGLLKKSRMTHVLLNRTPPPHVALTSTTIRYRLSDITAWLESVLDEATRPTSAKPKPKTASRSTQGAQHHA
ncbi:MULTISPECIES: helix-turn-helix transcriptional regulator [unclassified Halomonas]|uniref:MerR family transcriptional regulator n=1 Tax=Halomonas sp. ZM3 TaxID=1250400 RepID=K7T1Z6_9GAMM|nr:MULTISPECIES: hypothetical protein [unclassified Halomonas]AFW03487.1 MerR family transcriptional regulator [Halomonas sp. ZM3]PKG50356.1 hypothetical protein CXF87_11225 [Halomonas sp. MES3-P3E]